jgi:hypothetical protein
MRAVRVLVQFPRPDASAVITRPCLWCKAKALKPCLTSSGVELRVPHMVRVMDALGYGRVGGREVYAWKAGPYKDWLR